MLQLLSYSPAKLCDGAQMAIFCVTLRRVFAASRMQHISHMHSNSYYGHIMCQSMVDIQSATADNRPGKKRRKKER